MLDFNPETRISIEECIKNPVFDSVRENVEEGK